MNLPIVPGALGRRQKCNEGVLCCAAESPRRISTVLYVLYLPTLQLFALR